MLKSPLFNFQIFFSLLLFLFLGHASSAISQEIGAWTNLGLYGGQIYDIAIDPSNPENIFAGSYLGDGLFRTIDGGSSWQPVETAGEAPKEDDFKNQANYAVKIAPTDTNLIWVAHNYWVENSTDGGQTWTHILNSTMQRDCANCESQDDDFRFCRSIAVHPMNPEIVYVGTGGPSGISSEGAVYRTIDGGKTWAKHESITERDGLPEPDNFNYTVVDLAIDPNNPDIIWAITDSLGKNEIYYGSLYRSADGGKTWTNKIEIDSSWYDLEIKPDEPNIILVATFYGVLRILFDASGSFQSYTCPLGWNFALDVRALAFDTQDPNVLYAAWQQTKVSRSADGGESFGDPFEAGYQFITLAVHPANSSVLFGGELNLGVYKSRDHGRTWTSVNNGINASVVYDLAIDPNDSTHILAGAVSGLYEKKADGPWSRLISDSTTRVEFHPNDSQRFYAGLHCYVAKTTNGGLDWTYTDYLEVYDWVNDIAIDPADTNMIFIAVGNEIQKSIDGGVSFSNVLDGLNQSGEAYDFNVMAIDPSDHRHIFAGGGNFYDFRSPGDLWESTDGGVNWTRTALQDVVVNTLLINPDNPKILYAGCGFSGGVGDQDKAPLYKSKDGGTTWIKSYDGIPHPKAWNAVTDLEFHPDNTKVMYAGTLSNGIYVSPNEAGNWLKIGTPKYDVLAISTSSLYAATQGGLLQCTGTGLIAGQVRDALSQSCINNATVFNDLGAKTISVNGEYMMVSPSGTCIVTAIADGYASKTAGNITVYGGDVTWVDIAMGSQVSEPSTPGQGSGHSGRDYQCFIATAAYGSPMAEQVQMLRSFRDKYLLPCPLGQKLVSLYYAAGKPAAKFIESHPSLKRPVRIFLYPMVGLAWLLLSANAFTKVVIGTCIIIGCAVAVRGLKFGVRKSKA